MSTAARWPSATAERPCPICQHTNRCRVAPDGTAAVCWRNDGKVIQCGSGNGQKATRRDAPRRKATGKAHTYATAEDAIRAAGRTVNGGTLTATYTYRRRGTEVMRVARFGLPDGTKEFRPVHCVMPGCWKIGDPPGPLPLYRMDELPAAGTLWVCEGEKATGAAAGIGLAATTSAHGSAAAERSDWTPLAGRDVVILPDHDEPGAKYARDVARMLVKLDPPAQPKIVNLPGLPAGGDIVEYVDARDSMETESIRASIIALADAMPFIGAAELIGGPVVTCLADVQPCAVRWLWPGRVPLARITLLVGRPGEGKSVLTTDMTARVSTGTPWPDGCPCERGSVLLVSAEDDPADTIRPRLDAHRADVRRVHLLSAVRRVDRESGDTRETVFTLADVAALEDSLRRLPDCRLIVVDPIGSYLGGQVDSHRDSEVRAVLAPVAKLAERYGPAVLVVAHRRKSTGGIADDLALGSRAFTGIARAVWHLSRDPENRARRLLLAGKLNLAPEGDGLAFAILGDPPAIVWEREPVTMSADDALARENGQDDAKPGPEPEVRNMAAEWLRDELADLAEHPVAAIREAAQAAGLAWRTVQRAADELRVIRHRATFGGGYVWRLPRPADAPDAMRAKSPENERTWHPGTHDENGRKTADSACQVPLCATFSDPGTHGTNGDGTGGER